jgi:transposase
MRAYSVDFRQKLIRAIRGRISKDVVACVLGVGVSSVKRYIKMAEKE